MAIFSGLFLSACADKQKHSPAKQRQQIRQLSDSGDIETALQLVGELISRNPDDPETMKVYGHVLVKAGKGVVAEGVLLRAEELGVDRSEILLDLAGALMLQEKYREAVRALDAASKERDADITLLAMIADAELQIDSYDQEIVFETFLQLYKILDGPQRESGDHDRIAAWIDSVRKEYPVVESAWQHFSCALAPAVGIELPDEQNIRDETGLRVLKVGPERRLKKPSDAVREARDGDIIEIDAGIYAGDVATWTQNNLVLRGVGGMAHMKSGGATAENKGIWFFKGNNNTVEHIEFSGARSTDQNGSGIRLHGAGLTVRNSYFHDNEDGILGGYGEESEVLIEYSEFARNGFGDGRSHNIYIGQIGTFTLRYSYSHHAIIGHLVKSRARNNFILYNRILDESTGNSSYVIDIPEGGRAYIIGNELHKGPASENPMFISLAAEKREHANQAFYIVHNTMHNQNLRTVFVKNYTDTEAILINNLFIGAPGILLQGPGRFDGFLEGGFFELANPKAHDYSLTRESPAIDAGVPVPEIEGMDLLPEAEYVHNSRARKRQAVWKPDLGAHEFCGL